MAKRAPIAVFMMKAAEQIWQCAEDIRSGPTLRHCAKSMTGKVSAMKHKVTVQVETKKHFLGIPYTATEKKRITVDGKTYRKMKQEAQRQREEEADQFAAAALIVWEEEMVNLFGE